MMLQYSYNNIVIIVTNAIWLEFLSARFVHPGTLQLTILSFFTGVRTWNNETFNKLFFLTSMTSELSKNLNEQLVLFISVKKQI